MVSIGFIVEGTSDKIILESDYFKKLYHRLGLHVESDFFRIAENKPDIKKSLIDFYNSLTKNKLDIIFLLADQDADDCFLKTKNDILTFSF
jgi:hypothetical protein